MVSKTNGSSKETSSFSHTPGWNGWIQAQVKKGDYRNKSDVIESALKELKDKIDPKSPLSQFIS